MELVTRSKSVESIAVTRADRRHMRHWPTSEHQVEHVEVNFDRHGRGYKRQADFEVYVTFDDVLALIDAFAAKGHVAARLLHDNARALASLERIEAEIAALKTNVQSSQNGVLPE